MTLLELRRYAIQKQVRVQFRSPEAGECVVNEHGVLKIPSLAGVPQFQFDSSLAGVERFDLIPVQGSGGTRVVSREELESLVGRPPVPAAEPAHED